MSTPGWGAPGDGPQEPAERQVRPDPPEPSTATIGPPQRPSPWELPPPGSAAPPPPSAPTGWPVQPVAPYQPQPWPGQQPPSQPPPTQQWPTQQRPGQPPTQQWPGQPPTQQWPAQQWPGGVQPYGGPAGSWGPAPRLGPPAAWQPRAYPQLLRGPNHRWWRPLASLGIVVGLTVVVFVVFFVTTALIDQFDPNLDLSGDDFDDWVNTPVGMLLTNLVLAAFIPVTMLAVWWGHGWRPRWVGSVAGGIRWRWLAATLLIATAFMGPIQVGLYALDESLVWKPEPQFWWLVVVVVLTTPLQAAGEEYLARGWLTQATGSLLPGRIAAAVLGALVSGLVFAALHGFDQSFWLFADRFGFGLVASALAWWTGGLEAGIGLHTANNYVVLVLVAAVGDMSSLGDTDATALPVLVDLGLLLVLGGLLAWLSRRLRLQRLFRPPPRP